MKGKENLLFIILSIFMIVYSLNFFTATNQKLNILGKGNRLIFLAFIILLLSTVIFNSQEIVNTVFLIRDVTFLMIFIVFFVFIPKFINKNLKFRYKLIRFFGNLGFVLSLYGLFSFIFGLNPLAAYTNMVQSVLVHPNYAAPIFVIGTICSFYYFISNKNNMNIWTKVYYICSIMFQTVAIFLTFSRNGIFAIIIFYSIFILFIYRKRSLVYFPVILISIPLFALSFITAKGLTSFISRFYLLVPAYYMMTRDSAALLWGYGITNTFKVYADYMMQYNVFQGDIQNPHNALVSAILMFGLIFVLIIMVFYLTLLSKGAMLSFRSKSKDDQYYFGFLVSAVVTCFALGIFESQLVMTEFYSIQPFLVFSGLLFLAVKSKGSITGIYLMAPE